MADQTPTTNNGVFGALQAQNQTPKILTAKDLIEQFKPLGPPAARGDDGLIASVRRELTGLLDRLQVQSLPTEKKKRIPPEQTKLIIAIAALLREHRRGYDELLAITGTNREFIMLQHKKVNRYCSEIEERVLGLLEQYIATTPSVYQTVKEEINSPAGRVIEAAMRLTRKSWRNVSDFHLRHAMPETLTGKLSGHYAGYATAELVAPYYDYVKKNPGPGIEFTENGSALPQANVFGFFTMAGRRYGMVKSWARELAISDKKMVELLASKTGVTGQDVTGSVCEHLFFEESAVLAACTDFMEKGPLKVQPSGFLIITMAGGSMEEFAMVPTWAKFYGITSTAIHQRLGGMRGATARDTSDKKVKDGLYSRTVIRLACADLIQEDQEANRIATGNKARMRSLAQE